MSRKPWFDKYGNLQKRIPKRAVMECSIPGRDAYQDCKYWVRELGFSVPRKLAISYLREYGAWSDEDLHEQSDEELAIMILWMASSDIRESGEWLGVWH